VAWKLIRARMGRFTMLNKSSSSTPLRVAAAAVFVAVAAIIPQAQQAGATLAIDGDVKTPLTLTLGDIRRLPRTGVTLAAEGRDEKYEGVIVGEILERAGAPLGRDLSGAALATYVVASARDGYRVVFSLAELDPALTTNDIIVADTVDGRPLSDNQGPLRIVVPHDNAARVRCVCWRKSPSYVSRNSAAGRSAREPLADVGQRYRRATKSCQSRSAKAAASSGSSQRSVRNAWSSLRTWTSQHEGRGLDKRTQRSLPDVQNV